jgi:uncharacterized cupin superfamily protein
MPTLLIPTPSRCPHSPAAVPEGITVVQLEPDERLHVDDGVVCVADGLLYVRAGDDDVVLTSGDQIALSAGAHAWNAGDEPAQVIITG